MSIERSWSPQRRSEHWPVFSPSAIDLDVDANGKYRAEATVNGKHLILACLPGMDTYELFFPDLVDELGEAASERGIWDASLRLSGDADLSVEVFREAVRLAEEADSLQDLYLAVIPHLEAALAHQQEAKALAGRHRLAYDRPLHAERVVNGVRLALDGHPERVGSPLASPSSRYVLRISLADSGRMAGARPSVPLLVELGRDRDDAVDAFLLAQDVAGRVGDPERVWRSVKEYAFPRTSPGTRTPFLRRG